MRLAALENDNRKLRARAKFLGHQQARPPAAHDYGIYSA
jgi:hypothetical protein